MDEARNNPSEETQSEPFTHLQDVWLYCVLIMEDLVDFTDEEGYGKFLDLHHIYLKFCNLKQFQVCTILLYHC